MVHPQMNAGDVTEGVVLVRVGAEAGVAELVDARAGQAERELAADVEARCARRSDLAGGGTTARVVTRLEEGDAVAGLRDVTAEVHLPPRRRPWKVSDSPRQQARGRFDAAAGVHTVVGRPAYKEDGHTARLGGGCGGGTGGCEGGGEGGNGGGS